MRAYIDTRDRVARLLAEGLTVSEVAAALGISTPTVCFHKRKLGYEMGSKYSRRYDWREVQAFYDQGHSITECRLRFGMASKTIYDAQLRGDFVTRAHAVPLDELLVAERKRNRGHVKSRLLRSGLKEERCEGCGLTEWRGKPIPLQLHHVNGDGMDQRLENLEILCANCHSQTDNWGGRNARRTTS